MRNHEGATEAKSPPGSRGRKLGKERRERIGGDRPEKKLGTDLSQVGGRAMAWIQN